MIWYVNPQQLRYYCADVSCSPKYRCLDLLHLVFISQACYHYVISNWGNAASLETTTPELDMPLALVGLVSFVCQAFFLYRFVPQTFVMAYLIPLPLL